jgi:hypothetical protein
MRLINCLFPEGQTRQAGFEAVLRSPAGCLYDPEQEFLSDEMLPNDWPEMDTILGF